MTSLWLAGHFLLKIHDLELNLLQLDIAPLFTKRFTILQPLLRCLSALCPCTLLLTAYWMRFPSYRFTVTVL